MKITEHHAVEFVARLAPWLAPGPSAYFVARAARKHLEVPDEVAAIMAAVIETLGIATVATALRLYDWNQSSLTAKGNLRKGRTLAPAKLIWLSVGMGTVYLVVTICLTVLLEVHPDWATYAPAIFPVLAVVGAVNLAIRSNQARRELDATERSGGHTTVKRTGHRQRSNARSEMHTADVHADVQPVRVATGQMDGEMNGLDAVNAQKRLTRAQRLDRLVQLLEEDPDRGPTELAQLLNVKSRTTVYNYLNELEEAGRISRNGR